MFISFVNMIIKLKISIFFKLILVLNIVMNILYLHNNYKVEIYDFKTDEIERINYLSKD